MGRSWAVRADRSAPVWLGRSAGRGVRNREVRQDLVNTNCGRMRMVVPAIHISECFDISDPPGSDGTVGRRGDKVIQAPISGGLRLGGHDGFAGAVPLGDLDDHDGVTR